LPCPQPLVKDKRPHVLLTMVSGGGHEENREDEEAEETGQDQGAGEGRPMVVRIPIAIRCRERVIETSALVNSGYEADRPEVLLPASLARRLGLSATGAEAIIATPIGIGRLQEVGEVEVRVAVSDREAPWVVAYALMSFEEREVLLSDYLTSALSIAVEDFKEGLWRFRDEPLSRLRRSSLPRLW